MSLVLFFCFFAAVFTQTPTPPPPPVCDTTKVISGYSLLDNKVILYSPAAIGVDAHAKVDLYTSYFNNMHKVHVKMLQGLNATHVLVGENWSADGGKEHEDFMTLLSNSNMKLIVTFPVPLRSKDMTSDDFTEVIDESKKAWIRLVNEFTDFVFPLDTPREGETALEGFYFKPAPAATMSNDDLHTYYDTIGTFNELLKEQNASYAKFFVGYPIDETTGDMYKGPDYINVPADVWTIDFLSGDKKFVLHVIQDFFAKFRTAQNLKLLPFLVTDSGSGEDSQCLAFQEMYDNILNQISGKRENIWGSAISEMTDEWWRSYSAGAGYSVEGCPNSNAYAHSLCGVRNYGNGIVAMEYIGLWSLRDIPFQYCYQPKKAVAWITRIWHQNNATGCPTWADMQKESPPCAWMNILVPLEAGYALLMPPALCFVVLALILLKAPPIPPRRNEEEMSMLVESLVA